VCSVATREMAVARAREREGRVMQGRCQSGAEVLHIPMSVEPAACPAGSGTVAPSRTHALEPTTAARSSLWVVPASTQTRLRPPREVTLSRAVEAALIAGICVMRGSAAYPLS